MSISAVTGQSGEDPTSLHLTLHPIPSSLTRPPYPTPTPPPQARSSSLDKVLFVNRQLLLLASGQGWGMGVQEGHTDENKSFG